MSKTYIALRQAELNLRRILFPRGRSHKNAQSRRNFEADRKKLAGLLSDPNSLGFAVSEKRANDKRVQGVFCLTFFVRHKRPKSRLRSGTKVPKRLRLATTGSSVLTDVVELERMHVAHASLAPGASIGHIVGAAEAVGTVTLIAKDKKTAEPLILGCSHVLAEGGNAQQGDPVESPPNPSQDPGPNVVGHLTDRFMVINPAVLNRIDAALAEPVPGIRLSDQIPQIGQITGVLDLNQLGPNEIMSLPVMKFGAETGLTSGKVTGFPATVPIRFPILGDRVIWFTDVATYDAAAAEGDSGAPVAHFETKQLVGMHIAGSSTSSVLVPMKPILETLQIQL